MPDRQNPTAGDKRGPDRGSVGQQLHKRKKGVTGRQEVGMKKRETLAHRETRKLTKIVEVENIDQI